LNDINFFDLARIKYIGAWAAFGEVENYLSVAARLQIYEYEGFGGVFVGRTCTLDPLSWDKDITSVLGDPPFSGVYTYVEVWAPVSSWFGIPPEIAVISAGAGFGTGFFEEGPTFVGKWLLGVSAELLKVIYGKGEFVLVNVISGEGLAMKGGGRVTVKIGPCPVCIPIGPFSFDLFYEEESWDIAF
jgi:hypothetical protein